jgi:hypothetical protein
MVTRWGMSERLGLVQLAPRENHYLNNGIGYGASVLKHETLDEQEVLDLTGLPAAPQLRDGILPLSTSNGRGRRSRSIGNGSKA